MRVAQRLVLMTAALVCVLVTAPRADPMPCYGDTSSCETDYYPLVAYDMATYDSLRSFMDMTGDPQDTCNAYFGANQWESYEVNVDGSCSSADGWMTCTDVYISCHTILPVQ